MYLNFLRYLAVVITIIVPIIIIINLQGNIINNLISYKEGFDLFKEDNEDESYDEKDFDADDSRDKIIKILELFDTLKEKEGNVYLNNISKEVLRDINYLESLWDEENDEWKEKAYNELAEKKIKGYTKRAFNFSKKVNKIFENYDSDEINEKAYQDMKKSYGETGVNYIKQFVGIVLDIEMEYDNDDKQSSSFF
tara:strand:- start:2155 stop:2739 length:585 start_codon:yes stop_codon:yes gene_type:complete